MAGQLLTLGRTYLALLEGLRGGTMRTCFTIDNPFGPDNVIDICEWCRNLGRGLLKSLHPTKEMIEFGCQEGIRNGRPYRRRFYICKECLARSGGKRSGSDDKRIGGFDPPSSSLTRATPTGLTVLPNEE
jgi:hypothetical protein